MFALIPLVLLVVASVCGVLLTAPSTMSNLGYVLTRTLRERGVTCPPREAAESAVGACSADEAERSLPTESLPTQSLPNETAGAEACAPTSPTAEKRTANSKPVKRHIPIRPATHTIAASAAPAKP